MRCQCPFGMADWRNRLRAFIIYIVFPIKKKKCIFFFFFFIIGSLCCIVSSAHGLPEADHCEQRIEYRTRNSEASCRSIPSLASDCGLQSTIGKIQGDGRKFLDRFKSYFGSKISSQSLNEVHIYPLQPKSATKGDFFHHIFLSLIVTEFEANICSRT